MKSHSNLHCGQNTVDETINSVHNLNSFTLNAHLVEDNKVYRHTVVRK